MRSKTSRGWMARAEDRELGDAQIMDSSQPTCFLSHWVRETGFFSIEEGVRRITSDTADLFGLVDRGRIVEGAYADINVIDYENLRSCQPEYVNDLPHNGGRYIVKSKGYDATIVGGKVVIENCEYTDARPGSVIREFIRG